MLPIKLSILHSKADSLSYREAKYFIRSLKPTGRVMGGKVQVMLLQEANTSNVIPGRQNTQHTHLVPLS